MCQTCLFWLSMSLLHFPPKRQKRCFSWHATKCGHSTGLTAYIHIYMYNHIACVVVCRRIFLVFFWKGRGTFERKNSNVGPKRELRHRQTQEKLTIILDLHWSRWVRRCMVPLPFWPLFGTIEALFRENWARRYMVPLPFCPFFGMVEALLRRKNGRGAFERKKGANVGPKREWRHTQTQENWP